MISRLLPTQRVLIVTQAPYRGGCADGLPPVRIHDANTLARKFVVKPPALPGASPVTKKSGLQIEDCSSAGGVAVLSEDHFVVGVNDSEHSHGALVVASLHGRFEVASFTQLGQRGSGQVRAVEKFQLPSSARVIAVAVMGGPPKSNSVALWTVDDDCRLEKLAELPGRGTCRAFCAFPEFNTLWCAGSITRDGDTGYTISGWDLVKRERLPPLASGHTNYVMRVDRPRHDVDDKTLYSLGLGGAFCMWDWRAAPKKPAASRDVGKWACGMRCLLDRPEVIVVREGTAMIVDQRKFMEDVCSFTFAPGAKGWVRRRIGQTGPDRFVTSHYGDYYGMALFSVQKQKVFHLHKLPGIPHSTVCPSGEPVMGDGISRRLMVAMEIERVGFLQEMFEGGTHGPARTHFGICIRHSTLWCPMWIL